MDFVHDHTRPDKPAGNGLSESFNGRRRDEFLNVDAFVPVADVCEKGYSGLDALAVDL